MKLFDRSREPAGAKVLHVKAKGHLVPFHKPTEGFDIRSKTIENTEIPDDLYKYFTNKTHQGHVLQTDIDNVLTSTT